MKKDAIKDIGLIYDTSLDSKIEYFKIVIENNYELFIELMNETRTLCFIPNSDEDVIYIDPNTFDNTFYNAVDRVYNNDTNKEILTDSKLLPTFYLGSLVKREKKATESLVQPYANISDERFDSFLAYIYFNSNGSFNQFVEYLKTRKKDEKEKIFEWLKDTARFDAYNYLIDVTIDILRQFDEDFLENIGVVIDTFWKYQMNVFTQMDTSLLVTTDNIVELEKISTAQLDKLFCEFLNYINAPNDWIELYEKLKKENNIVFKELKNKEDSSMCYEDNDGVLKILLFRNGTTLDFCTFVHEFMHYISMQRKRVIPFAILEFSSLFFEKLAAEFLKDYGYNKNIINIVNVNREKNNFGLSMSLAAPLGDILRFVKKGSITKEDKINLYQSQLKNVQETREKMMDLLNKNNMEEMASDLFVELNFNAEEVVNQDCDALIDNFIKNGWSIINGYQYLLGTLLVDAVLKKEIKDNSIIEKLIDITNRLCEFDVKKIMIYLNILELFETLDIPTMAKLTRKPH